MIIVLDDICISGIEDIIPEMSQSDGWFDYNQYKCIDKLIDIARDYFDLEKSIGYEMHKNLMGPTFHYDKDEMLYQKTKVYSFPLCSMVYYPKIENLIGGDLAFESLMLKPVTNRLVLFSSNLMHGVKKHTGTRVSIGINPWGEKPLAYKM